MNRYLRSIHKNMRTIHKKVRSLSKKQIKNYLVLLGAVSLLFLGGFTLWVANLEIPSLESFENRRIVQSTKIYDSTGEVLLYDVNQNIQRTVIPFDVISQYAKDATIAIEDKEFYQHNGIKPRSILRAIFANTTSLGYAQGGSTITQQVIKNALFTSEKLLSRKIKEWVLAVKLEKVLSKDEILSNYLNEIPYGGNIYGIEEASQTFFGKSASEITLAEAAYLAALPQAPTFYSPFGKNKSKLDERKNLVLREMFRNNMISESEYEDAKTESVTFLPKETENIKAPHFVFYVIDELTKEYGEDVVQNGGLRVKTTLNYEIQKKGEEIANRFALQNKETFNAENASFVAIDPKTGGIVSMVGSRNYFDEEIDGNFNIATALRQPGSTFKPFVYAEAFNRGYTPETVLFDVKTQFSTTCSPDNTTSLNGCYSPDNYDNNYRGPMTMRESLAQSINITSVKTLYLAGIKESIRLAESLGIGSLGSPSQYGLTLVLGGGEVKLLDMVSAYGVFAHEGVRNPYHAILEVKSKTGEVLYEHTPSPTEVLPRNTALLISDVLSDNVARAPAFGQSSFLAYPSRDVAVKTGTTNDYKDAWIIGYTPNVVLGAWAGNNDNTPMEKKVAGFIVAPMWREYMDTILATLPEESFPEPLTEAPYTLKPVLRGEWRGGKSTLIDTVSGKKATEYTPIETTSEILSGGIHSILHWVNKNDPRGAYPTNPESDGQYRLWEYGVSRWVTSQGITVIENPSIPSGFDDVHTAENTFSLSISTQKSKYLSNEKVQVQVQITSPQYPVRTVSLYVNNQLVLTSDNQNADFSFIPSDLGIVSGEQEIKVVVANSVYNSVQKTISVSIESQ